MTTEVSIEGIIQSGESLLNNSETLSGLFEVVEEVTNSINSNMSGFDEVEQLIDLLKNINLTKDKLISKINEFGNYLLNTIAPGYEKFMEEIGKIEMDTSFLADLETLFGVTFERITYSSSGLVEGGETISQVKPITNEDATTDSSIGEVKAGRASVDGSSTPSVSTDGTSTEDAASTSNYTYSATAEEIDSPIRLKTVTPRTLPITEDEFKRLKDPRGPRVELPPDPNRPVEY